MGLLFAKNILKYKGVLISVVLGLTAFFTFHATKLEIEYGVPKLLSRENQAFKEYKAFNHEFGAQPNIFLVGIDQNPFQDTSLFKAYKELAIDFENITGVDSVVSINHNIFKLEKDTGLKSLKIKPLVCENKPLNVCEEHLKQFKIYENRLYADSAYAMLINIDSATFDSKQRSRIALELEKAIDVFEHKTDLDVKISGLAQIKTIIRELTKKDLIKFILLSFAVAFLIIFCIFRSIAPLIASLLVISIGIAWSLGITAFFGIKMGVLTGLIPTLVVVIGVPNCIYIINHFVAKNAELKDKQAALINTLHEVGRATFLTNFTTAVGFFAFYFTSSEALQNFGYLAAINVLGLFFISIVVITFILSIYKVNDFGGFHNNKLAYKTIEEFKKVFLNHKKWVFSVMCLLVIIAFVGTFKLQMSGNLTDDIPKSNQVFKDIQWFEKHFGGVIPLEIVIDGKKNKMVEQPRFLKKLHTLSDSLKQVDQISTPSSINDIVMLAKQAYYGNNPDYYTPIGNRERMFLAPYLKSNNSSQTSSFINSEKSKARISLLAQDLGLLEMETLINKIQQKTLAVFDSTKYKTTITGSSVVFLKGTRYLSFNLLQSILIAILVISLMMASLFKSFKMVFYAVITNLIPLILTAGLMGITGIPLKPSTILVFSIAFGISVDDTIHFLAKYKLVLSKGIRGKKAVLQTIDLVGRSMLFTSLALFFGFIIFLFSDFQGTKSLGLLLSFTLIVAMLCNLIFLPSMLINSSKKSSVL